MIELLLISAWNVIIRFMGDIFPICRSVPPSLYRLAYLSDGLQFDKSINKYNVGSASGSTGTAAAASASAAVAASNIGIADSYEF